MTDSILLSVRSACNIEESDESFDNQLIPLINDELLEMRQIGVGDGPFEVEDEYSTWEDFNPEHPEVNGAIASVVGQSVRLIFDPPSSSMATESIRKLIDRSVWRINAAVDFKEAKT